jgi:hypothetical protein
MTTLIRPAGPDDSGFIARNILASQRGPRSRGWFDIALGWPEPQCLDFVAQVATAATRSWWHVSQFVIAELDGEPAAALCASPATGTGVAGRAAIAEVAEKTGLSASELAAIFRRGAYASGCWVQGGEGDWLIEHVASLPACRGRGLVQALIARARRGRGCRLQASVDLVSDR